MTDSQRLLADYVENGSETAFRELVSRYLNLVYSAAVRLMDGDTHLAEDVSQIVFTDLARLARTFSKDVMLGGWLHRHTCFVAAKTMRSNRRRQFRERQAVEMNVQPDHSAANLAEVAPVLDDAINQLGAQDRAAILLRFFEQRDLRAVGEALGGSENAAQKRVTRALEELRALLKRRGVAFSGAGLATALAGEAVTAAPVGLAASISSAALTGAAAAGGTGLTLLKLMTMTKLKAGIAAAIAITGVATPLVMQHQTKTKLREENQSLREQVNQLAELRADNARLSNRLAQADSSQLSKDQLSELMRLRGEVGLLRKQTNELGTLREENRRLQASLAASRRTTESPQTDSAADQQKRMGIAKMNDAKLLVLGMIMYAQDHQNQYPANFDQFASYVTHGAAESEVPTLTGTNQFEIVYHGALAEIPNPQYAIVIREKDAWPSPNGGWNRTYGFADGHSEIAHAPDGNFENYETWRKQHIVLPAPAGQ